MLLTEALGTLLSNRVLEMVYLLVHFFKTEFHEIYKIYQDVHSRDIIAKKNWGLTGVNPKSGSIYYLKTLSCKSSLIYILSHMKLTSLIYILSHMQFPSLEKYLHLVLRISLPIL